MQVSKHFLLSCTFCFAAAALSAQNTAPTAPVMPVQPAMPAPVAPVTVSPSMPAMPSISSPVAGSSFYTPGEQFQKSRTDSRSAAETEKTQENTQSEADTGKKNTQTLAGLTAQDLVALAKGGSISSVSALFNGNLSSAENLTAAGLTGKDSQTKLLNQVLSELQEIKNSQNGNLVSQAPGSRPSALPPKIIRFTIGNRDIISALTQVYFSDRESDGTFLLTCDSRCIYNNKVITETLYMLFRSSGTKSSKTIYEVTSSLLQSSEAGTPLRQFTRTEMYTATRTGNFVTLHGTENNLNYDMLLDIGSSVPEN